MKFLYIIYCQEHVECNPNSFTITNKINPIQAPISSLPKYNLTQIPSNYIIITRPASQTQILSKHNAFFTDESRSPNPGKGVYGWYSPNYNNQNQVPRIITYHHPVTMNKCVTMATFTVLEYIKTNPPKYHKTEINMYTDSLPIIQCTKSHMSKYNNLNK